MSATTWNGASVWQSSGALHPIEELCLLHDEITDRVMAYLDPLITELNGRADREARYEIAQQLLEAEASLKDLYCAKVDAGYFDGVGIATERCAARLQHLKAEHRHLLGELRRVRHEVGAGSPSKARRQLRRWIGQFSDVLDREADVTTELGSFDSTVGT